MKAANQRSHRDTRKRPASRGTAGGLRRIDPRRSRNRRVWEHRKAHRTGTRTSPTARTRSSLSTSYTRSLSVLSPLPAAQAEQISRQVRSGALHGAGDRVTSFSAPRGKGLGWETAAHSTALICASRLQLSANLPPHSEFCLVGCFV